MLCNVAAKGGPAHRTMLCLQLCLCRRLQWSDAQNWLEHRYPALADSFLLRDSIMEQAAFLAAATADQGDGFQQARALKNRRKQQQQQQLGWVWGVDALQDWISSSPVQDWQRDQWMQRSVQQWEEEAARGLDRDAAAANDSWSNPYPAAHPPAGPYAGQANSYGSSYGGSSSAAGFVADSSSNPFAALTAGTGDGDGFSAFLAQLQAATAAGAYSSSSVSATGGSMPVPQQQGNTGLNDWLLLGRQQGASAAADSDSEGDGWEVASLSSISSAAPPAAVNVAAAERPTAPHTQQTPAAAITTAVHGTPAGAQQPAPTAGNLPLSAAAGPVDTAPGGDKAAPPEVLLLEAMDRPIEDLLLLEDVHTMSK